MNPFTQILEVGSEHLKTLRYEAHLAQIQPKQPSLRRRVAKILKSLAAQLEQEPLLALKN